MSRFFDINNLGRPEIENGEETNISTKEYRSKVLRQKLDKLHARKLSTLKNLCGRLPEKNEFFFLETTNSFNAFTFIVYLVKNAGRIEELYIATYSINLRIIDSLSNRMRKNEIGKVVLEISESIKYRMPKVKDRLDLMAKKMNNFLIFYSWTHKKVLTAKIGESHYVVEGSGNFSENSAREQYVFTNSKKLYEFRSGFTE